MNEAEFNELRLTSWQRPLSPEEEVRLRAWLAAHPEDQAAWEEDQAMDQLLAHLPEASLPSNFTAQTLQAFDREKARVLRARSEATRSWHGWLARWLPRTAFGALAVILSMAGWHYLDKQQNRDVAQGVEVARTLAAIPHPEMLKDFDIVDHLSGLPPGVDVELLAALE